MVRLQSSSLDNSKRLQQEIAKKVIAQDEFGEIKNVCGIDVSYRNDIAYCSAAMVDKNSLQIVETASSKSKAQHPYIPGFLMLREAGPILDTLKLLKNNVDLLLIDGHGLLHPRRCGLACYVGVMAEIPTVGVAKSLLCGKVRDNLVELDGKVSGTVIQKGAKKIYVSIGHKISLESASAIVQSLIEEGDWMPKPLRIADANSKTK